jgi:tetratricopeptide (TPR) repeat protein
LAEARAAFFFLPMPTHRKLRRKELKQPDEFLTFFEDAWNFLNENLNQVLISAAVVAGAALIVISVYYYERHRDHLTARQFYQALQALQSKDYKLAEQNFIQLANDEPGRELGRLARFYLAASYLGENNLPRARDALVGYLAEGHNQAFEGLALIDLGIVYERMGDLQKAQKAYEQAASIRGDSAARGELAAARVLARRGERQAAVATYRDFLASHPFAPERQDVVEALAQLGAAPQASPAGAAPPPAKGRQ